MQECKFFKSRLCSFNEAPSPSTRTAAAYIAQLLFAQKEKERKKHTAQWSSEFLLCSPCHKGRLQAHLYHKRDSAGCCFTQRRVNKITITTRLSSIHTLCRISYASYYHQPGQVDEKF